MLRKSPESIQHDLFTSRTNMFTGKTLTIYNNSTAWHNLFLKQITMSIDEAIFKPLFSDKQGRPSSSIRVLVAMMILKESEGMSDQKLFENCRFNSLYSSALGLLNADDVLPTESTYYLFRKNIVAYEKEKGVDLFSEVFSRITKKQCLEFDVSGKSVRMDSKLLGSNIAWMSRYELILKTLQLYYKDIAEDSRLDLNIKNKLKELFNEEGSKVVYRHTSLEIKAFIVELGTLINSVLNLNLETTTESYKTLQRVFEEQYKLVEQIVLPKEKEEISATSVQSPFDTDCTYRNKGGNGQKQQQIKGYAINITETCDDESLNLITKVNTQVATTSDVDFLENDLEESQEIVHDKITNVHADGAYNSTDNQYYCKEKEMNLYLHAIQGSKGKYAYEYIDEKLKIVNTQTNETIEYTEIVTKKGEIKWRIKENEKYRYITKKEIDTYFIRQEIEKTSPEILQKRNNVEATIFQLGYHYPNAKSRYRGLMKHKMWANLRSLWINFVRILNFVGELPSKMASSIKINILLTLLALSNVFFDSKSKSYSTSVQLSFERLATP